MNFGIRSSYDDSVLVANTDDEVDFAIGDTIIFEHGDVTHVGRIVWRDRNQLAKNEFPLDGEIKRVADDSDKKKLADLREAAVKSLEVAREKLAETELPMQITSARHSFDDAEVCLFFTSTERIDFKEIVPKLAGALKKKVHLAQLGPRDRAAACGGYGICGQKQCCSSGVVREFKSISMEMAKNQELAMKGNEKLSGNCGKLLCCLAFENDEYKKLREGMPKNWAKVKTPDGTGKVISLDVLTRRVRVALDDGPIREFAAEEVKKRPPQKK